MMSKKKTKRQLIQLVADYKKEWKTLYNESKRLSRIGNKLKDLSLEFRRRSKRHKEILQESDQALLDSKRKSVAIWRLERERGHYVVELHNWGMK